MLEEEKTKRLKEYTRFVLSLHAFLLAFPSWRCDDVGIAAGGLQQLAILRVYVIVSGFSCLEELLGKPRKHLKPEGKFEARTRTQGISNPFHVQ